MSLVASEALVPLGFTPFFQTQVAALVAASSEFTGLVPARVTRVERGEYALFTPLGARRAVLAGALELRLVDDERPCVGDFVLAVPSAEGEPSRVELVLERTSLLRRRAAGPNPRPQAIAANVDLVCIVSAHAPAGADAHVVRRGLNARRVERYLAAIRAAPARACLAVTKADLSDHADERAAELAGEVGMADTFSVSAVSGAGIDALAALMSGQTSVLVGSSGVGKSSLTNRLLGRDVQDTQAVRDDDARGRHTTTRRELFVLPSGGVLIDTPGMREFGVAADDGPDTETGFEEIDRLRGDCRFRDCRHETEPGCAVLAAVGRGEITTQRLTQAHKLRREQARIEERHALARRRSERRRERR